MGLDKKPTPPPKRVKEDGVRRESVTSPKDAPEMETERTGEDAASHSECETSQPQGMEIHVEAEPAPEEDKVRDGITLGNILVHTEKKDSLIVSILFVPIDFLCVSS